jgi:hypothetical protein
MPHVVCICLTPPRVERKPAGRYARVAIADAVLIEGHGVEGDAKGGGPVRVGDAVRVVING